MMRKTTLLIAFLVLATLIVGCTQTMEDDMTATANPDESTGEMSDTSDSFNANDAGMASEEETIEIGEMI